MTRNHPSEGATPHSVGRTVSNRLGLLRRRWGTERRPAVNRWRIRSQQPAAMRRLRRRLTGSSLDAAERAILELVMGSVEPDAGTPDTQWPVATADLTEALQAEFRAADVEAAIERLASQDLLLHAGEEVSLTSAGVVSLGGRRRPGLRRGAAPAWTFERPDARARARHALVIAREQLEAVRALEPPAGSDSALRSAIRTIDRISDSLS